MTKMIFFSLKHIFLDLPLKKPAKHLCSIKHFDFMELPGQWQSVSTQVPTAESVLQLGKLHYTTRLCVTTADTGDFYLAVRLLNCMQRLMTSALVCIQLSLINSSCFQLHLHWVCVIRFQQGVRSCWRLDLCPHGESSVHWRFAGRICDPMGNPCWSSLFLKDWSPQGPFT